jgi:hypothetical protein
MITVIIPDRRTEKMTRKKINTGPERQSAPSRLDVIEPPSSSAGFAWLELQQL